MDNIENIFEACKNGDLEKVKNLIEQGADIEAKDDYGNTPLILVSWYGCIEVIKFLVEKGADIEAKDNYGNTPLLAASHSRHMKVDQINEYSSLRLDLHSIVEAVKFLVENGADIETKNNVGNTPLNLACFYGYIENVKFLVEKGADIKNGNIDGYNYAECYLSKEQKEEIEEVIIDIQRKKEMIKPCRKKVF